LICALELFAKPARFAADHNAGSPRCEPTEVTIQAQELHHCGAFAVRVFKVCEGCIVIASRHDKPAPRSWPPKQARRAWLQRGYADRIRDPIAGDATIFRELKTLAILALLTLIKHARRVHGEAVPPLDVVSVMAPARTAGFSTSAHNGCSPGV
jgi:hypothetical protein